MLETEGNKLMNENDNAHRHHLYFKCDKCDYRCKTRGCLMKHTNSKHVIKQDITKQVSVPKCSLCDDNFNTLKEYEEHIQEHKDEIEDLDVTSITNGHELFECNLCSFESGHEDSIKEHLLDHVSLPSNASKKEQRKKDKVEALKSGNLLDLYDDDGNPLYDTTDSECSDSE